MPASLNNKILIVAGPTGAGKSVFAAGLANQLGGEILCADAFQIYAGMAVLTAQPGADLLEQVPHQLYGEISASEAFNAASYAAIAGERIREITSRGRVPILVGGSGLYLKAILEGLSPMPPSDPSLRAELAALSHEEIAQRLHAADPSAADLIDMKNLQRVLRALEICLLTGRSLSESRGEQKPVAVAGGGWIALRDREDLHERIERNVRSMFSSGVVEEVKALGEPGPTASRAIGLREIQAMIRGELSQEECIVSMVTATRQYAKRQLTWFRNQCTFPSLNFTTLRSPQVAIDHARALLAGYPA